MLMLLSVVAFLAVEHDLKGMQASVPVAHGLNSCGSQALEPRLNSCGAWASLLHIWDLPGPGIEPVSPALAGGFFTTEPPGMSQLCVCVCVYIYIYQLYIFFDKHCF